MKIKNPVIIFIQRHPGESQDPEIIDPGLKHSRMTRCGQLSLAALFGFWILSFGWVEPVEARPKWGQVRRIVKANIIQLRRGDKVRLLGIEVPEPGNPFYAESLAASKRLMNKKEVRLRYGLTERDREGNWLAYVFSEGILVNEEIIRDGWAWVADVANEEEYLQDFLDAEAKAKKKKRGVWAEFVPEAPKPWERKKPGMPWATYEEIKKGKKK